MSMKHVSTGTDSFQGWMTPRAIAQQLVREFGLTLDVAAADHNAVCPNFFTEDYDALTKRWCTEPDAGAFVNPPYNDIAAWLEKARVEVESGRCGRAVFLVPASVGTAWVTHAVQNHEIHLFDGRIRFDLPADEHLPEKYRDGRARKSPGGGSILVIIEKDGLVGVTAVRSSKTGEIVFDFLDVPVQQRSAA